MTQIDVVRKDRDGGWGEQEGNRDLLGVLASPLSPCLRLLHAGCSSHTRPDAHHSLPTPPARGKNK